uniref:Adenylyl cyclase G n=1 Tax=Raperostelium minutum TaxID=35219 RepID=A8DXZ5_9MYCE|nr:adenylyl cyclase G [Raperostelium minutum]
MKKSSCSSIKNSTSSNSFIKKCMKKEVFDGFSIGFILLLIIFVIIGIFFCIFTYVHYSKEENDNIRTDLERISKQICHYIELFCTTLETNSINIKALYYTIGQYDKNLFDIFLGTLDPIDSKNVYYTFSNRVEGKNRKQFEIQNNLTMSYFDYQTRQFHRILDDKDYYYPIIYVFHKFNTMDAIIGFDQSTDFDEEIQTSIRNNTITVGIVDSYLVFFVPIYKNRDEEIKTERKNYGMSSIFVPVDSLVYIAKQEVLFSDDINFFLISHNDRVLAQEFQYNFTCVSDIYKYQPFKQRIIYSTEFKIAFKTFKVILVTTLPFELSQKTFLPTLISIISSFIVCLSLFYLVDQKRKKITINQIINEKNHLIHKILPEEISKKLESGEDVVAERSNNASVFFLDIAGFTRFSSSHTPEQVIQVLIKIFNSIDLLCSKHNIEKIKTIGDAYMATCGLTPNSDDIKKNTSRMLNFALDVLNNIPNEFSYHLGLKVRIGIHCGPVISGVISGYSKPHFDVWGDSVNIASRMESTGLPGQIHVSDRVYRLTRPNYDYYEDSDVIQVKGKGKMKTWYLLGKKGEIDPFAIREKNFEIKFQLNDHYNNINTKGSPHYHIVSPNFIDSPDLSSKSSSANLQTGDKLNLSNGSTSSILSSTGSTSSVSSKIHPAERDNSFFDYYDEIEDEKYKFYQLKKIHEAIPEVDDQLNNQENNDTTSISITESKKKSSFLLDE